jgi:CRP-like cAMP-binding protein
MGQRNAISLRSRRESHSADAVIIPSGSADDDFFILIEGEITIARDAKSITTLRSDLSNNFFGISSVLNPGTPRDTDVSAKSDVELLRIPLQTIRELFDENMGIRYLLTAKGAERRNAGE